MKPQKKPEGLPPKEYRLQDAIEQTIQEMSKEKQDNPNFFSYIFLQIYNEPQMYDFIQSVYEYSRSMIELQKKVAQLREQGQYSQAADSVKTGYYQLQSLGRLMAHRYGQLIMNQRKYRIRQNDQSFFQTINYFFMRTFTPAFQKADLVRIEQELGRLFRSTAFNIPLRHNVQQEKSKNLPVLKGAAKKDPDLVIKAIIQRNCIPKHKLRPKQRNQVVKLAYSKLSPYKAMTARSPLISMILPSPNDKIRVFEESRKRKLHPQKQEKPKENRKFKSEFHIIQGLMGICCEKNQGAEIRNPIQQGYLTIPKRLQPQKAIGIINLGNTCFVNAALQCILNTQPVSDYFLSGVFQTDINQSNPLGTGGKYARALASIFYSQWLQKRTPIIPVNLLELLWRNSPFDPGAQHDAHEFLCFFLDKVHQDVNRGHQPVRRPLVNSFSKMETLAAKS